MKTSGAIRHKIQQIRFRYLKKVLESGLSQHPDTCLFYLENEGVGLCSSVVETKAGSQPIVCTPDRCKACTSFSNIHTKESLKQGFKDSLEDMPLPELAYHYPDLAALQWAIEDDVPYEDEPSPVVETPETPVYRSWFRRLLNV